MKYKNFVFVMMFLLCAGLVFGATRADSCTQDQTLGSGGTDYYAVATLVYNYTGLTGNVQFKNFTAFTPRLNFSVNIQEANQTLANNSYTTLTYYNSTNVTVLNASDVTIVLGAGNYSVGTNGRVTWALDADNFGPWNNTKVNIVYQRKFVKNVDDLALNYYNIRTDHAQMINYTSNGYKENTQFKLTDTRLDGNNWAVTYSYYTYTCLSCSSGIAGTLFTALMTFFMLGILVYVGYGFYNTGNLDVKMIIALIVALVIMVLMIPVINSTILNVCQA